MQIEGAPFQMSNATVNPFHECIIQGHLRISIPGESVQDAFVFLLLICVTDSVSRSDPQLGALWIFVELN